jgi:hypothetical protein
VFHFELRQFPHVARAFNLSREELVARVLEPWTAGRAVEWDDRRWAPDRARLTILEGPELAVAEIGLGRGWANAARTGTDVTAALLSAAPAGATSSGQAISALAAELLGLCAADWAPLSDAVRLAAALYPQARPSEQLGLAEQTVWELLHAERLALGRRAPDGGHDQVVRERWQELIMDWTNWSGEPGRVAIRAQAGSESAA